MKGKKDSTGNSLPIEQNAFRLRPHIISQRQSRVPHAQERAVRSQVIDDVAPDYGVRCTAGALSARLIRTIACRSGGESVEEAVAVGGGDAFQEMRIRGGGRGALVMSDVAQLAAASAGFQFLVRYRGDGHH